MSSDDDQRGLIRAYAHASTPSSAEVERALTRTLARIDNVDRSARLPDARRRLAWAAVAAIATLVIGTGALAGVRWYRAQTQPVQTYGEARFDRVEIEPAQAAVDRALVTPTIHQDSGPVANPEPPHVSAAIAPPKPRARPPRKPASDVVPTVPDANLLADESHLIASLRRALHANDYTAALAAADEHAKHHSHGALIEERLVLEGVAACRAGQRERGRSAAKQLREQFPKSPATAKVEQACADN